ncbi:MULTISPECIES: MFS transporter [Streptomyces]|uniref:MFS transporter n=1 Tax=Streptomyces rhizosphaericola TaxID=2564098 RepID=A0ABY2PDC3_9ACTN|nr:MULTISPECIES: MFS transporter [Streptomyces]ARI53052.1 MFS transporter [Streptomyces sp. S8]MYT91758.1 MFS transporter [Streptomyces sp. SID8359]MYT99801.1 MFS transporter [Streptomyces sp. SID8350]NGO86782.1 MFS transporter [Streptomyces sp. 196(2019)]TGZ09053.1 MFS transporter [Streptomyces rhizosphaericola]
MSTGPGADSAPAPASTHESKTGGTFSSLKIRNYRLFATGAVISNTGTWMSRITQDWLVLSLTGSATAVGITTALQFLPMLLFGLYGGVIADRLPKRQILLVSQAMLGLCGIALAVLTLTGVVEVWHVYLIAFLLGMVTVVDNPARQSFVSEMVGPAQLRNAVSLNSANFQSARLIGPAVAGVLITTVGSGWAFLLNGLSFLAPLIGLLMMRTSELHASVRVPRAKGQLREGLRYVRGRPELIWPIVLVGFVGTFGFNFPIWLTAFADGVFDGGAGMYSFFNILMAAGSLAGALLSARRRSTRLRMLVAAGTAFGLLEIAASLSPYVWLFSLLLVPIGMLGLTTNITANTSVQMAADPEMRGRVMSLYMMVFAGGTPVGAPIVGWISDTYGARVGFASGGVISVIAALAVGFALARVGGLRLKVDLRQGRPHVRFVPRERLATAA